MGILAWKCVQKSLELSKQRHFKHPAFTIIHYCLLLKDIPCWVDMWEKLKCMPPNPKCKSSKNKEKLPTNTNETIHVKMEENSKTILHLHKEYKYQKHQRRLNKWRMWQRMQFQLMQKQPSTWQLQLSKKHPFKKKVTTMAMFFMPKTPTMFWRCKRVLSISPMVNYHGSCDPHASNSNSLQPKSHPSSFLCSNSKHNKNNNPDGVV